MSRDIPIANAMLCWTGGRHGDTPACRIVPHPDERGYSDAYRTTVGACFASWSEKDTNGQRLHLMVEAWHAVTFDAVPAQTMHEALLVIPEYRSMLADGCLPSQYLHERA